MIHKKESLTRISKCHYNPKYRNADIKSILNSLQGTGYHRREIAEKLLDYREAGLRWNNVEDAIDVAHLARCRPIIDRILKEEEKEYQIRKVKIKKEREKIKNLNRRKEEEDKYELELKLVGVNGYYNDFLVKAILKYLNDCASFYAEIKVALMTIEHYQVKNKYPLLGKTMAESWINDVNEIIEKIQTDKGWMKKVDAIINEIHGDIEGNPFDFIELEKSNDLETCDESNSEEYVDDSQWFENQQKMSDQYNNRVTMDGLNSYSDYDDIDDGWRVED